MVLSRGESITQQPFPIAYIRWTGREERWQPEVRDWSLIMGRGGLQNGKIAGPKLFAPPLKTG